MLTLRREKSIEKGFIEGIFTRRAGRGKYPKSVDLDDELSVVAVDLLSDLIALCSSLILSALF